MFSFKIQFFLWLVAAFVAAPVIRKLGLDRPRGADDHLSRDELETAWRHRLNEVFEFLALIGGSLGVLYLMHRSLAAGAPPSARGIVFLLSILLWTFGFVVAIVVLGLVGHFIFRAARTAYHLALCLLFVFGFLAPLIHDNARDRAVTEERNSVADQYIETHKRMRLQWRKDVEAAGTHGGEGIVPPMLDVLDSGDGVQVTNIGGEPLCLDLRRSNARLGPPLEYQCALWSERGSLHACVELAPGQTEWLHMTLKRPDLPDCSGEPLEFRVGTWQKESIGWWSDAALEEFDRRTQLIDSDPRFHEPSFDFPRMRSNDFMREVMRHYERQVVGPPRVASWRAQIEAAEHIRASARFASPADRTEEARRLDLLRKAQARVRDVKSLHDRLSRGRDADLRFPDYFRVEDQGNQAMVHHSLGAVFYVTLARAGHDPATGAEFVCAMRGLRRGTELGTYVSKSQPGHFTLASTSGSCSDPRNSTLEMIVHNFEGHLTFASPTALDRLLSESEEWLRQIEAGRPILPE